MLLSIGEIKEQLRSKPRKWLVTGVAGFIGSNLLEELLKLGQTVVGLDNFSTGYRHNLGDVKVEIGDKHWKHFTFYKGDIINLSVCRKACKGVEFVLHQAALGSVPKSIDDPITTNQSNIDGFLNMLVAARDEEVKRFVYAASSATYGDCPDLPEKEEKIGRPLSPYAVTKYVNELYADVFMRIYGLESIGLRYFNVFGKRQDPNGAYAAVIPKWIDSFLNLKRPTINGDGKTSRDFCYINNVVEANLLAATVEDGKALNKIYNIAYGKRTSLNQLYQIIRDKMCQYIPEAKSIDPIYGPFRKGDVRYSLADISRAKKLLGYHPRFDVKTGIHESIKWYINKR
jgi:UDP-N-acetylglucosamine 4-epimerase